MKNRFVGLSRLLTGFKLGRQNSKYVLPNNLYTVGYNCLENGADKGKLVQIFVEKRGTSGVIWITFKWPIFTMALAISQVKKK